MKLGKINLIIIILINSILFNFSIIYSEDKISTVPLINLENLQPSYESENPSDTEEKTDQIILKNKKKINETSTKNQTVKLIGLDKITAKTSEINIPLGDSKKFGFLKIKALKCGEVESVSDKNKAAYIQVIDLTDKKNEKVFVFNGWTFSSNPSFKPLDHPVYDIWLLDCENT